MKNIILLLNLVFFLSSGCGDSALEIDATLQIGTIEDGNFEIIIDKQKLKNLMLSSLDEEVFNGNVNIEKLNDERIILIAKGINSKKESRTVGFELSRRGSKLNLLSQGEKHTCSGVNCSNCSYFIGCDCNQAGDETNPVYYCNHTVVTDGKLASQIIESF